MTTAEAFVDSTMYLNSCVSSLSGALMGDHDNKDNVPKEIMDEMREYHAQLVIIQTNMKEAVRKLITGE